MKHPRLTCDKCSGSGILGPITDVKDVRPGVAFLCAGCKGRGYLVSPTRLWTKRKKLKGIQEVVVSGQPPHLQTYKEFVRDKRFK